MSCSISVVVRVERGGSWLTALTRSLDGQSLAVGDFEVVYAVSDTSLPVARRLQELSTRRPNVRVITGAAAAGLDEQLAGSWVLDLGTDVSSRAPRLLPQALQRLLDFAEPAPCDVVLGRTVGDDAAPASDLFVSDRTDVDGAVVPLALGSSLVLRRRGHDGPSMIAGDAQLAGAKIGVLASYPCAHLAESAQGVQSTSTKVSDVSYAWRDGVIAIAASGAVDHRPDTPGVQFSVRHQKTGVEFWLTGRGDVADDGAFTATTELDVRTAAAGGPLTTGLWQVRVGVHGGTDGWSVRTALPPAPLGAGIVDGMPVAARGSDGSMALDVGATRWSVIGKVRPSAVSVTETSHGSLMSMALDVAAVGESRERGMVWLGDFDIPAHLVTDGSGVRVECYLSGLPGSSPMATRFGGGKPASTGLTVTASDTGIFTVAKTPPDAEPRRPAAPRSNAQAAASMPLRSRAAQAAGRAGGKSGAAPSDAAPSHEVGKHRPGAVATKPAALATRLRRRVPAALEPLASALSRSRAARRIYRKLAGLPTRKG